MSFTSLGRATAIAADATDWLFRSAHCLLLVVTVAGASTPTPFGFGGWVAMTERGAQSYSSLGVIETMRPARISITLSARAAASSRSWVTYTTVTCSSRLK